MTESHELAAMICELGRRMFHRGMVAANDGNLSVRLPGGRFLTTPTGVSKGFMKPAELCILGARGEILEGDTRPSTEARMHLAIYRARPDVNAVVHAHPPHATAFAISGRPLDERLLAEVVVSLGPIPLAEFQLPSTDDLAETVAHYAGGANAVLLSNHGAVTLGASLQEAYFRMETLEHFARISLYGALLGEVKPLAPDAVAHLEGMRGFYGVSEARPEADAGGLPTEARIRALVIETIRRLKPEPG